MKKFLTLTLLFVSAVIFVPTAEAKTDSSTNGAITTANYEPQNGYYQRRRRNNRRVRVYTRTRIVRRGYATYREVWQYRSLPNGRVQVRLLSRTRIR